MLETQASSLISALMDTVWDLLHHYRSAIWRHDDVEDKLHRATGNNKNLQVLYVTVICDTSWLPYCIAMLFMLASRLDKPFIQNLALHKIYLTTQMSKLGLNRPTQFRR